MTDQEFRIAFTTYLGQECPVFGPLAGRYFGHKATKLDKYGINLAAAPLPGQGHRVLHNNLQSMVQAMMKVGGIYAEREAGNFLLGKVDEPWITQYVNHVTSHTRARNAPFAIVPDLHAINYPTRQRFNDSGATSSAEAIFEVKSYVPCISRYDHNNQHVNPADRRAKQVSQEYKSKFKKLDRKFAADVVGDGTGAVVGPFEAAQGNFLRQQVIPLVAGGFGEIGEDFDKVITRLAREAAAGDHGLRISPLVNTDRKGGAFPIMLQQFRRAIGVAIVRGNARHKLGRLHYVRTTPEEAAATCRANHSNNRWMETTPTRTDELVFTTHPGWVSTISAIPDWIRLLRD